MGELQNEIFDILKKYVAIDSITNSKKENKINAFLNNYINSIKYFKEDPNHFCCESIPDDVHNRSVNWAFLKGKGEKTIVFIHHSDVVNVDNFNEYIDDAFSPEKLTESFHQNQDAFDSETIKDLCSENWLFGRGVADMKGGGAIQLALLKELSQKDERIGNIVLLVVPDEENLSAGMRHGVKILKRLKEEYKLDYQLMINSEPHQRLDDSQGMISQGSIAKMNFFVYVKGILTHSGEILEGINPMSIMGQVVSRTELNLDFVDEIEGEMSIPPTWVHLKDSKETYDISTPESVIGYINVLNFSTSPEIITNQLKDICLEEVSQYMNKYNRVKLAFSSKKNQKSVDKDWIIHVITYNELLMMLRQKGADSFEKYELFEEEIIQKLKSDQLSFIDANYQLLEYSMKLINRQELFVVIGLTMPMYPGVSNLFQNQDKNYLEIINAFTEKEWKQTYMNRFYFTGISDLSYSSLNYDLESTVSQMKNMPLWNKYYEIPFEEIKAIQMPCINIGPWGKDLHKVSERVYIEDLLIRTPSIIKHVIKTILYEQDKNS